MNPIPSGLPDLQQPAAPSDDEVYQVSPLQFTADRLGKLVRIAERDPKKQVTVDLDTLNKLYMAYLGVLEGYQENTQAGVIIRGERYPCSKALQEAVAPLIQQERKRNAEKDVDREIETFLASAKNGDSLNSTGSSAAPLRVR
jgi:hypothetical protein